MSCLVKRTWAEIDLDHLDANYEAIRSYISRECRFMAIVKADAYGHGAPLVAKEYERLGADYFGVSNIEEAMQLRKTGITKPILILGYTPPDQAETLASYRITQAVFSLDYAKDLSGAALAAHARVRIHIKIDTGMSRIGFVIHDPADEEALVSGVTAAVRLPGLEAEGVFTHFAVSDEPENPFTGIQFSRFTRALTLLAQNGVTFAIRHCCNSAGLLNFPQMHLDMVRPGIILYGLTPAVGMKLPVSLSPVLSLKSVVFQIKELAEGTPVSYGMKYVTPGVRTVGTIPIGYADGYLRSLSNNAQVLVNGRRAGIVGRVCMDQCMADLTGIPGVREGDPVTLIGRDGGDFIPIEEIAEKMGTINYEVACVIGKRVPRVYFKGGKEIGRLDYILP